MRTFLAAAFALNTSLVTPEITFEEQRLLKSAFGHNELTLLKAFATVQRCRRDDVDTLQNNGGQQEKGG
jgi:hypothetical protein